MMRSFWMLQRRVREGLCYAGGWGWVAGIGRGGSRVGVGERGKEGGGCGEKSGGKGALCRGHGRFC